MIGCEIRPQNPVLVRRAAALDLRPANLADFVNFQLDRMPPQQGEPPYLFAGRSVSQIEIDQRLITQFMQALR